MRQAMFVPMTVVNDRTPSGSLPLDVAHFAAGRIEIGLLAHITVIGSVARELAEAMMAALRGRRLSKFVKWREDHGCTLSTSGAA